MRKHERWRAVRRVPSLAYPLLVQGRYDFTYDQMPISVRGMSWAKRMNLAASGLNLLYRRLRPWSMPLHMQFELTSFCNLRCPICPTGNRELKRPAQSLDPSLFGGILDEVGPYLLTASLWGWGESILHPQLGEMLRIAGSHDLVTFLSTNGQHLGRDSIVEAILEFPPSHLIVAIDGLTDETNSRYRIGAKLEPALRAVERLAELKVRRGQSLPVLHMRFIVMEHNEPEVSEAAAFAERHGFDMLTLRALSAFTAGDNRVTHSRLLPKAPDYHAFQYDGDERLHLGDHVCMEPFWFPSLFADGTLVCCEQDFNATQPLGVIGNGRSFADLWNGSQTRGIRRTIRDAPDDLPFCRCCPARDRPTTDLSLSAVVFNPGIADPVIADCNGHA